MFSKVPFLPPSLNGPFLQSLEPCAVFVHSTSTVGNHRFSVCYVYISMCNVSFLVGIKTPVGGILSTTFTDLSPGPSIVPDSQEFNESLLSELCEPCLPILNSYSQYLKCWGRCQDWRLQCGQVTLRKSGGYSQWYRPS